MRSVFVLFLFIAIAASNPTTSQIKSVAILFRHGQRTPSSVFPTYGATSFSNDLGMGQLTLTGSKQLYEVGVDLRKRYLHLFPSSGYYRQANMRVLSSPVERCIGSLTSFMAGFMPPPANDKTIPFRWQAFPFVVDNEHRVVVISSKNCPKYLSDMATAQAAFYANTAQWIVQDKAVLDRISAVMGVPMDSLRNILPANDLIGANRDLDKTMPQWLKDANDATLKKYVVSYFESQLSNEHALKVQVGNLITQMIDNLVAVRDGTTAARNMLVYSGHDSTMTAFAYALGIFSQLPESVPYGATIAMELHKVASGALEVQLLFVADGKKTNFNIPNCGKSCPLNTFISLTSNMYVSDWNALCAI